MTVIASGSAKDGFAGSPKLDYDDDQAYDARARLTHMWNDRRTNKSLDHYDPVNERKRKAGLYGEY